MGSTTEDCLRIWDLLDSSEKEEWLSLGIQIAERTKIEEQPSKTCIFCPTEAAGVDAIVLHMTLAHNFSVADKEYCNNVEGLLDYLASKVKEKLLCLWCDEKKKAFFVMRRVLR